MDMTRSDFDDFCRSLPATTHVIQWGGASVWKIGGRIFALCSSWGTGSVEAISFKCSDFSYRLLCEQPGIVPAPYLARAKWVQVREQSSLDDGDLRSYIDNAHGLVATRLTRAVRRELGLMI